MTPESASWALLVLFILSWLAAALWTSKTTGALPPASQAPLYAAGLLYALLLATFVVRVPALRVRLWPQLPVLDWILVSVCVASAAWCWWARLRLGRLWAGSVVVRQDPRVVDTGPYAIVRHPIYTGAFVGTLAFVAIRARAGDLAFALGFIGFFALKARLEEQFLREQLGAAYDDYRARVPMLVPRLRLTPS